jgi:urea transport system permease protein
VKQSLWLQWWGVPQGAECAFRSLIFLGSRIACLGSLGLILPLVCLSAPNRVPNDSTQRQKLALTILSEAQDQQRLLSELADGGAPIVRDVLLAWTRDGVYLYEGPDGKKTPVTLEEQQDTDGKARAIRIDTGQPVKDADGKELRFSSTDLTAADTDNRLRSAIQQTLDALALSDPDVEARRSAIMKLGNSGKAKALPVLESRLAKERDPSVKRSLHEAIAMLQLTSTDPKVQVMAIQTLSQLKSLAALDHLKRLLATPGVDASVSRSAQSAVKKIDEHLYWVNVAGTFFRGASLGSILLVVALGLAITFGLMGIINMAHGELIAVGAYTCYVVQNLFGSGFGFSVTLPFHFRGVPISFGLHLPGLNASGWLYEAYFALAVPLSFATAALVGLIIERTVIRFLYRRPLEYLLATWGISLVMQQCFRMVFGANNVQVNSPSWLLGHYSVNDVLFGYNRLFVIAFALMIVVGTWLLLTRTSLGLLIRAVMQNRAMAACVGVRTTRVNMLTFAFGSGLAGLAGAFLSQIGNVGPSLGQTYIVDSFMTVVVGGVGSIVGTVWSALGIGTADQILQQVTGSPVTGKIVVLITIILFLQWKPGGLFPTRSRTLD